MAQTELPSALKIGESLIEQYPVKENFSKNDVLFLINHACAQFWIETMKYRIDTAFEENHISELSQIDNA
jgi:hypothetical protein